MPLVPYKKQLIDVEKGGEWSPFSVFLSLFGWFFGEMIESIRICRSLCDTEQSMSENAKRNHNSNHLTGIAYG